MRPTSPNETVPIFMFFLNPPLFFYYAVGFNMAQQLYIRVYYLNLKCTVVTEEIKMYTRLKGRKKGVIDKTQLETMKVNRERIKKLFEDRGKLTILRASSELGLNRGTVRKHFKELWKEGFVYREGNYYIVSRDYRHFFELSGFDKKVVKAIRSERLSHVRRSDEARDLGAIYLATKPVLRSDYAWGIVSPHEIEFLYNNPCWLREIFRYALRERLVDKEYFSEKKRIEDISNKELDKLWHELFGATEVFAVLFALNPKRLLEWLKTEEGREDLKRALSDRVRRELYDEALKLWRHREVWGKRIRGMALSKSEKLKKVNKLKNMS